MIHPNRTATLAIGTQVRVTDHQPAPPARSRKQRREWHSRNYIGAVVRSQGDSYTIQGKPAGGWGAMAFVVRLCSGLGRQVLIPIEGAPVLPIRGSAMDATVDPSAVVLAGLHAA